MRNAHRILMVEDEIDYQRLLKAVLTQTGDFHVVFAPTLDAGIAALPEFQPGVILLDLSLPDSVGLNTLIRMKAAAGQIPIIVLTAVDDDEIALHLTHHGAHDYLVKQIVEPRLISRCIKMALTRNGVEEPHTPHGNPQGAEWKAIPAQQSGALLSENDWQLIRLDLAQRAISKS